MHAQEKAAHEKNKSRTIEFEARVARIRALGQADLQAVLLRVAAFDGGFNGWRQHFSLLRKMECRDRAASSDLLYGQPASGDMGSLAARGIDEFDRAKV